MPETLIAGTPDSAPASPRVPLYSWYALAILTLVYVLNFLDRTLIYILFAPIKKEMSLSDFQLALLGATSFVIFYTLLGIPFGRLADRTVRKNLIGAGLAIWSLFSGLTGFAHSFWALFFCRLMVGVGEATLGPAALSLLSDYFPPRMRATVQSIYASGIAVGGGLAFFLGGWIGQTHGWRWAFYLLGFPGLALAVLVFFLREEPRGGTESAAAMTAGSGDWKILFRSVPLRYLYAGYALFALSSNNLGIWVPTFFVRVHHMSLLFIGTAAGILSIVVGVPVTIMGGYFSDRFSRMAPGGRMAFTACAAIASIPLWLALLFANNSIVLLLINIVLYGFALMWVGPAAADVHDIAGPRLRGLGIGIFFSTANIMAYGIGAPLIGRLNDKLGVATNPEQMRWSLLVCPATCVLSALLLWLGSRSRKREGSGLAV
jgi:MFS family permease